VIARIRPAHRRGAAALAPAACLALLGWHGWFAAPSGADCFPPPVAEFSAAVVDTPEFVAPIALDANRVAMGVPHYDFPGPACGAVRVHEFDGSAWVPAATVLNPDPYANAHFGAAVALEGVTLMVGRPGDASHPAKVYVFEFDGAQWNLVQQLTSPNPDGTTAFGVAIALDGTTAMIADDFAYQPGASPPGGAVEVFVKIAGAWVPTQTLYPTLGVKPGGRFGFSLDVDGDHMVVGAPHHQHPPETNLVGAAYFFRRVAGVWVEVGYFAQPLVGVREGSSVAISGTRALVAAPYQDPAGALHAYSFDGSQWQLDEILVAPLATGEHFGHGVSMHGDRAITLSEIWQQGPCPLWLHDLRRDASGWKVTKSALIGDPDLQAIDLLGAGRAAFDDDGTVLVRTGHSDALLLELDSWPLVPQLSLKGSQTSDAQLGRAMAADGDRAVFGAPLDGAAANGAGAVYACERVNGAWNQTAKLTMSDAAVSDNAGSAVAISGDRIVVGAYNDDDLGSGAGSAYVFEYNGSAWTEVQKLLPLDGAAGDQFGYGVAISGNRIAVGAPRHDLPVTGAGAVYVFEPVGGVWTQVAKITSSDVQANDFFGWSVALEGDRLVAGAPWDDGALFDAGAAYAFHFDGASWIEIDELLPWDVTTSDHMGESVAISGDRIVVGMRLGVTQGVGSGVAFVYSWNGSGWPGTARLHPEGGSASDWYGCAVAIRGNRLVVGARLDDDLGFEAGAAYVYVEGAAGWNLASKRVAGDGQSGAAFGYSVALGEDFLLVGAPTHNIPGNGDNHGVIYPFEAECQPVATVGVPHADTPQAAGVALSLHPNPLRGGRTLFLRIPPVAGPVTLSAFDVLGRRVRTWRLPEGGTNGGAGLDVSGLPPGSYALRLETGSARGTARFVLSR